MSVIKFYQLSKEESEKVALETLSFVDPMISGIVLCTLDESISCTCMTVNETVSMELLLLINFGKSSKVGC